MNNLKIIETGSFLPNKKVLNCELEQYLDLEAGYIQKRTGIKERYFVENETIEEIAIKAANNLINKNKEIKDEIDLIIVATTTTNNLMPGVSNYVQKNLKIKKCICIDILAGCSGYINALDIAKMYIQTGEIKKALIIGVEVLSKYLDKKDIGTSIILSDGAGAIIIGKTEKEKKYYSNIEATLDNNNILSCKSDSYIQMNGKEVYKYAVTNTVENVKELLKKANEDILDIKYVIPHQSNMKIIKSIASKLNIEMDKVYTNIDSKGNTFCASIPIALNDMKSKNLIKENDKIILLGYGGGLNTGSILLQI